MLELPKLAVQIQVQRYGAIPILKPTVTQPITTGCEPCVRPGAKSFPPHVIWFNSHSSACSKEHHGIHCTAGQTEARTGDGTGPRFRRCQGLQPGSESQLSEATGPWLASDMTVAGATAPRCAHLQAEGCQPGNTAGANSAGTWTSEVGLRSGPCGQKPTMKEIPSCCTFSNKSPSHLAFLRFAGIGLWTICTKPQHHQHSGNEKKKVRTPSSLGRLEVRGDGESGGQWGMR